MGAVFAAFAAFYHWFYLINVFTFYESRKWRYVYNPFVLEKQIKLHPKKYKYHETAGILHFITTFIGVNLTFFPMHLLGLAGMPRRIPDYPDAYVHFNLISSFGSFVTLISTIMFFIIIVIFKNYSLVKVLPRLISLLRSFLALAYFYLSMTRGSRRTTWYIRDGKNYDIIKAPEYRYNRISYLDRWDLQFNSIIIKL